MSDKPNDIPGPADFLGWMNRLIALPTQAMATALPQNLPNPADPLELWKTLADRNEQAWGQFMKQLTATPEFAQTLGRSAGTMANYRLAVRKAAKAYLDAADIPSREDLTSVARQIVALDAKVDNLEESLLDKQDAHPDVSETVISKLENLETRLAALPTREELAMVSNRLTNLEGQINQLLTALNNLSNFAPAPAPAPALDLVSASPEIITNASPTEEASLSQSELVLPGSPEFSEAASDSATEAPVTSKRPARSRKPKAAAE